MAGTEMQIRGPCPQNSNSEGLRCLGIGVTTPESGPDLSHTPNPQQPSLPLPGQGLGAPRSAHTSGHHSSSPSRVLAAMTVHYDSPMKPQVLAWEPRPPAQAGWVCHGRKGNVNPREPLRQQQGQDSRSRTGREQGLTANTQSNTRPPPARQPGDVGQQHPRPGPPWKPAGAEGSGGEEGSWFSCQTGMSKPPPRPGTVAHTRT